MADGLAFGVAPTASDTDGLDFAGYPQPPEVPPDPTGEGWRGPPGDPGPPGQDGDGVPSDAPPLMDGAAAPGVATTFARGDHRHPTDTSRYSVTNPAGYQTAADVATKLAASGVINVLDYGAVADGKLALTTASLLGGNRVVVTDPIFAPTDVGKVIGVVKRYTGTELVNPVSFWLNRLTILTYVSTTEVTVLPTGTSGAAGPYSGQPSVVVWGTNNATAFQAALNRARDLNGGNVYVPRGNYVLGDTIFMHPNTTLSGDGAASQLINPGMPGSQSTNATGAMIANYNGFTWPGGVPKKTGSAFLPTTEANMIDHDITIRDLHFNYGAAVAGGSAKVTLFILARRIKFISNLCTAPGLPNAAAISCLGCWDIEEIGNTVENAGIALDHWAGIKKLRIISNNLTSALSGKAIQVINVNAAGTTSADVNVTEDVVIEDNMITMNGGPAGQLVAMFLDALGLGGSSTGCYHVANNTIRATAGTVNNTGIVMRGVGGRSSFISNIFDGLTGTPLGFGGINPTSANLTTPWTVVSGETTALINFPAHKVPPPSSTEFEGPWLHIPEQTVAGIVFDAPPTNVLELLVLQVVDANTLRVRLPSAATSSVTNGGASGSYWISTGAPAGMTVSDNVFLDMRFSGANGYMVSIASTGSHVGTNKVVFRDPVNPTCQYATIVRCEGWDVDGSNVVRHQAGPSGAGPTSGYLGNGNVAWVSGSKPLLVDDELASVPTVARGDESTSPASTYFAARLLNAINLPMSNADTTFLATDLGVRFINIIGTLTATRYVTIPATGAQRNWVIRNGTTGGFQIGLKGPGATPTLFIPAGSSLEVWSDGGNLLSAQTMFGAFRVGFGDRNQITLTAGSTPTAASTIAVSGTGPLAITPDVTIAGRLGINGSAAPAKPTISGSRGGNEALASLLTALASYGLVADSTSA